MKQLSQASKTAIGGMAVALSVVLLIPTALELFVYALPALAGILTLFCVIELGKSWAFGVYLATALLSLLLVPNKEAAVMYTAFFGYYAIVKALLEARDLPRVVEYLLKFLIFNASVVASYLVLIHVFGMPLGDMLGVDDGVWWAKYAVPVMLVMGNAVFLVFDLALTRMATFYLKLLQPRLRKLFRFK
ncbi:MAG: hypothetical protein IKH12_01090 [Clostridia bacterium]|nr:hypothetical protein [Clostridia bacterium]